MHSAIEFGKFRISFVLGWAVLTVAVFGIVLVAFLSVPEAFHKNFEFAINLAIAAGTAYSAVYIALTLRVGIRREQMSKAFDFAFLLAQPDFMAVRQVIMVKVPNANDEGLKKITQAIEDDPEIRKSVRIVLMAFENLALAIRHEYVNELVVFESLESVVTEYWERLAGYVTIRRNTPPTDPDFYRRFQQLAEAWKNKKSYKTGRNW